MENNQLELLERARAGDSQALEDLLRTLQPQLFRFSMKMCRHTEDAEDVLQDSMMTLARTFKDFRGASSFSTWLYTIARSFCIKKRRKSKFAPSHEESLEEIVPLKGGGIASSMPGPQQQIESEEIWQQVQTGIKKLEPAYREVLLLRDVEGLSAKEVSEVVKISLSAVKSRLHRARSELRDLLTDQAYKPKSGCPDIRKLFSQHLEGDLSSDICSTMEVHVENCQHCAEECNGLREVLGACSNGPCEVPAQVQEKVQQALRTVLASFPK